MAVYGSNFYGLFTYGAEPLVEFDASPFIVRPHYYNKISLNWTKPSGDWSDLLLVRNTFGFPVTPDDGDILLSVTNALHDSLDLPYIDSGASVANPALVLGSDVVYYYSIFVKRGIDGKWVKAGNNLNTSVGNGGTGDLMYEYTPLPYRAINTDDLLSLDAKKNLDLANFLNIFGFEYDYFKSLATNVKNRYDIPKLHGRLVPLMMDQFGFIYEPEMGIEQGRRLLENAAAIYLTKGSSYGVRSFIKAFSGYSTTISPIKNLFLTLEDSSFEHSKGNWASVSNATITNISGAGESPAVPPYIESTSPALFPNSQLGVLKVVAPATASSVISCGASDPVRQGIPVVAGQAYTFSIYTRTSLSGTARSVSLKIDWYTSNGTFISSSSSSSATNNESAWTRLSTANRTAPATAYFAVPVVTIAATAADIHYLDAGQFEKASAASDYVDARRLDLYLAAMRVNLAKNPTFASATTNWSPVSSSSNSVSTAAAYSGTGSLLLTSNGGAKFGCSQASIPVVAGSAYTWSMYVKDVNTAVSYKAEISWYDGSSTLISASTGTATAVTSSGWTRVSVTGVAPSGAATATIAIQSHTAAASTKQAYFDAALFEQTDSLNQYFDGDAGYYETTDLLWEDNDDTNGKSYYYKNRFYVTKRLITALPEYMQLGSTWALFIGS
jgi:hypothetical protein